MKIVITSFGSMGDIQPMLALAMELKKGGHHQVMAFPDSFKHHVLRLGLEFRQVGPDIKKEDVKEYINKKAEEDVPEAIQHARNFVETYAPTIPQMIDELSAACEDADILVSTTFQFAAKIVHEKLNIPLVTILFSHYSVNGSKLLRDSTAPLINRYREKAGLEPREDPLTVDALSNELVIFAVSKYIMYKSPQWPDHYHVSGFFFLEEEEYTPAPELQDFLARGSKPVLVSFGSMVHENPDFTLDTLLKAIAGADTRAVIQKGWSGLAKEELPPGVFLADYTPHTWLFPQGACIIHHGGAGTTAAGMYSGAPAIIVPHALDQPLWGQMAMALGCVSSVIPFQELTAEKLSAAISQTLENEKYLKKSVKMRDKIRAEKGVENARKLIEALVERRR